MFRCPHCTKHGVSAIGKLIAAPWAPAKCRLCGGKSSEPIHPTQNLRGICFIAIVVAIWASLTYSSWIPLGIFLCATPVAFAGIHIWVPLQPLSEPDVQASKSRRSLDVAILLFVVSLLAGLGYLLDA